MSTSDLWEAHVVLTGTHLRGAGIGSDLRDRGPPEQVLSESTLLTWSEVDTVRPAQKTP